MCYNKYNYSCLWWVMRILVCDDEKYCCQIIKKHILSNLDEKSESVVIVFNTAREVVEYCLKNEPDILFLDIELGGVNGIDLAKQLREDFPALIIVYISNHPEYVFSCFETEPLNFLRKPINEVEFYKTFQHIIRKYTEMHKSIPIKWQNDSVNLEIRDICYVEGYNRHLIFHLYSGEYYEVVGKLDDVYNSLKVYGFVKSHQGFIVNMLHIKTFGESEIQMKNGEYVLMSVRRKLKTKEAYSNYINRRLR